MQFKEKAVGSDVYEFEQDLRTGISKAHHAIKTELTRFCESKAKKFLEADIDRIRRGLQEDLYDSMETVLEHVELMKTSF